MEPHKDGETFEGRTFLLIRDHIQDNGAEPLSSALPAWLSPDIVVRKPDGSLGGEAEAGIVNQVEVTVHNRGGIQAIGTYVDAFFASSATTFSPAAATPIGGIYIDVPGYGMKTAVLPWTPPASVAGHGCILARASLIIPPDTYANPAVFDMRGDRHIAQRNIEVLAFEEDGDSLAFTFHVVNPEPRQVDARLEVRELREPAERQAVVGALNCQTAAFAPEPLEIFSIAMGARRYVPDAQGTLQEVRDLDPLTQRIPAARSKLTQQETRSLACPLLPGEICEAAMTAAKNPGGIPGLLHPLEIRQLDEKGNIMGGISLVLRN